MIKASQCAPLVLKKLPHDHPFTRPASHEVWLICSHNPAPHPQALRPVERYYVRTMAYRRHLADEDELHHSEVGAGSCGSCRSERAASWGHMLHKGQQGACGVHGRGTP